MTFVQAVVPGDLTAAVTGKWLDMTKLKDVDIVVHLESGAAAAITLALQQATDGSGTGAKVLPISEVSTLSAVDADAPTSSEVWNFNEDINRTTPVNSLDCSAAAIDGDNIANEFRAVVRVHQDDMDPDGFTHVRLNSAGVARDGSVVYISANRFYKGDAA